MTRRSDLIKNSGKEGGRRGSGGGGGGNRAYKHP
jgi:hypothetical protein